MLKNAGLQYQGLAPSQGVNSETATCLSSGLRILWEVCGYSVLLGCHRLLNGDYLQCGHSPAAAAGSLNSQNAAGVDCAVEGATDRFELTISWRE